MSTPTVCPSGATTMALPFPFSAIVGQEEMTLAIQIVAVDPSVGGVLALGDRGTGKSTAVRALADLLPPIQVVEGCAYGCDPKDKNARCEACASLKAGKKIKAITRPVPVDLAVTSLLAHMHVRGKAFKFELTTPDGKTETLLDLPNYDFNWQLRYDFKQPRILPRGSTVRITAVFDNSTDNKSNPDPTKLVRWGPQTYDEMMIGYFEYFVPINR